MSKKFLFFIVLLHLTSVSSVSLSDIIPIKKPVQSKEITEKKLLIDVLRPLPKPIEKEVEVKVKEEKTVVKKEKKKGQILPKKKPLVAGSVKSTEVKISKYYNKKDFNLAKKAMLEMKQAKWTASLKTAKKAKDKSIYNFIQWRHLLTKGNKASFYEYKNFIEINNDFPRIGRIKYLAEHKLSTDTISPKKIIDWFGDSDPLSGFGAMILGESFVLTGNEDRGIQLIKDGWITAQLTKSELRFYRKKFKKFLNAEDLYKTC